jgi:nucleotide-binding universal stress UspA family protein
MSALAPATAPDQDGDVHTSVDTMLDELAAELRHDGIDVETFACPGNAAQAILDIADGHEADLIVVGNKGMQGARRYLGSVPNSVAHQASCGVLIVRTS